MPATVNATRHASYNTALDCGRKWVHAVRLQSLGDNAFWNYDFGGSTSNTQFQRATDECNYDMPITMIFWHDAWATHIEDKIYSGEKILSPDHDYVSQGNLGWTGITSNGEKSGGGLALCGQHVHYRFTRIRDSRTRLTTGTSQWLKRTTTTTTTRALSLSAAAIGLRIPTSLHGTWRGWRLESGARTQFSRTRSDCITRRATWMSRDTATTETTGAPR